MNSIPAEIGEAILASKHYFRTKNNELIPLAFLSGIEEVPPAKLPRDLPATKLGKAVAAVAKLRPAGSLKITIASGVQVYLAEDEIPPFCQALRSLGDVIGSK